MSACLHVLLYYNLSTKLITITRLDKMAGLDFESSSVRFSVAIVAATEEFKDAARRIRGLEGEIASAEKVEVVCYLVACLLACLADLS